MQLKGKTAIITGAAGGIGRATVLRFVQEGCAGCRCRHSAEKGPRKQPIL